jgi:FkbM family methyltransferase
MAETTELLDRLAALEARVGTMSTRVEEIVGYFDHHLKRVMNSQAIYLGDHTALTFLESGQVIYVDTRSVDIGSHLLRVGSWEPNYAQAFQRLIKPGDTVLDLGANHGFYTLLAASAVGPTGHVHAFEANPRFARLTDMSAHVNGYGGWVKLHGVAVSDVAGTAELSFGDEFSGGGSLFATRREHRVTCTLVPIDELFPDPDFLVDVIKMDIEGAEGRALLGMRRLLERSTSVRLMMEFAPEMLLSSGVGAAEVTAFLRDLGFRAWSIADDSSLHPLPLDELARTTSGLQNLVLSRDDVP